MSYSFKLNSKSKFKYFSKEYFIEVYKDGKYLFPIKKIEQRNITFKISQLTLCTDFAFSPKRKEHENVVETIIGFAQPNKVGLINQCNLVYMDAPNRSDAMHKEIFVIIKKDTKSKKNLFIQYNNTKGNLQITMNVKNEYYDLIRAIILRNKISNAILTFGLKKINALFSKPLEYEFTNYSDVIDVFYCNDPFLDKDLPNEFSSMGFKGSETDDFNLHISETSYIENKII